MEELETDTQTLLMMRTRNYFRCSAIHSVL